MVEIGAKTPAATSFSSDWLLVTTSRARSGCDWTGRPARDAVFDRGAGSLHVSGRQSISSMRICPEHRRIVPSVAIRSGERASQMAEQLLRTSVEEAPQ